MRRSVVLLLPVAIVAAVLVGTLASAHAAERAEDEQIPFYTRLDPFYFGNEEWSAIVFYRPPECVPADFDLVGGFDIPRVFACGPQTVDAFAIRKEAGPPIQVKARGLGAVPIWFFPTEVAQAALSDGRLTIAELDALDPLRGSASLYTETLHPVGAAQVGKFEATARGTLEDGRSFFLSFQDNHGGGSWKWTTVVRFS